MHQQIQLIQLIRNAVWLRKSLKDLIFRIICLYTTFISWLEITTMFHYVVYKA